ncbi:hypothetical protein, partial [Bittarella massiliensis (ex Durand et al. 2017)]|uniref:hypothetical protein n=1 Tax=Bittarella massiliensis (ex Durand et al. 2017) TaxID=1720313 RepID=UPI003F689A24
MLAKRAGVVEAVSADEVLIKTEKGELDRYKLIKFLRSNQGTCFNQRVMDVLLGREGGLGSHPLGAKVGEGEVGAVDDED